MRYLGELNKIAKYRGNSVKITKVGIEITKDSKQHFISNKAYGLFKRYKVSVHRMLNLILENDYKAGSIKEAMKIKKELKI